MLLILLLDFYNSILKEGRKKGKKFDLKSYDNIFNKEIKFVEDLFF